LTDPLVLNVAELTRRPATRKAYELVVPAQGLTLGGDADVEDGTPVVVDVVVESLTDGLTVNGEIRTEWRGTCRRCVGPASGELLADVSELYQVHPTSEEAFAFDGEQLDLGPMVRELVLMELPPAPLCRPDCAGICPVCGADRNVAPCDCEPDPVDPRWAGLEELRARLENEA
jgi:DUF177 domain-containing protein